uniref:Reverse transcriptase/retrotransposon-derived protein RNase H-like domain-containing protein n=1 Tax=Trichuris muris TaxID=70415 RepID=A0A5S6PZ12_TRIMR
MAFDRTFPEHVLYLMLLLPVTFNRYVHLLDYSKFIANFPTVTEPFCAIIRTKVFCWNDEADNAYNKLKILLLERPASAVFDLNLPTTVTTDASDVGIGAVLSQTQGNGEERTVAFASRTLTAVVRKYSVVEKEALACVWEMEKWRPWLWGKPFTLCTDHLLLTTLLSSNGFDRASMRIAWWSSRLLNFDYVVKYKKGSLNIADAFSRLPSAHEEIETEEHMELIALISELAPVKFNDVGKATANCATMTQLMYCIQNGWPEKEKLVDPSLLPYFRIRN